MFPLYDWRERRVSLLDVSAIWAIAIAIFVAAAVWWML
jgi:hypothetical protein